MEKKKIAFYIGSLAKGGAERVVVNLAEYFLLQDFQVIIVTKEKVSEEYSYSHNIRRVIADLTKEELVNSRVFNLINRIKKLNKIWKEENPNIVISFIKKNNFMAVVTGNLSKVPVVVSVRSAAEREYPNKLYRILANILFCSADGVVVQTENAKNFFSKKVQKKITILPNSVNPKFVQKECRRCTSQEIITVGRLDENKNQTILIEAFSQLHLDFPHAVLKIYGDGTDKNKLEKIIVEKNLVDKIKLEGTITDVVEKMENARIFVLTSKVEGMPNALIEAMCLGLTVISTDFSGGGARMLIENEVNGLLVPGNNVEELKNALRKVLEEDEFADKLAEKALEIRKNVNPDVVNEKWKDFIVPLMKD